MEDLGSSIVAAGAALGGVTLSSILGGASRAIERRREKKQQRLERLRQVYTTLWPLTHDHADNLGEYDRAEAANDPAAMAAALESELKTLRDIDYLCPTLMIDGDQPIALAIGKVLEASQQRSTARGTPTLSEETAKVVTTLRDLTTCVHRLIRHLGG